jgi:hypothetical protein
LTRSPTLQRVHCVQAAFEGLSSGLSQRAAACRFQYPCLVSTCTAPVCRPQ